MTEVSITSGTSAAVVEGLWQGMKTGDALARASLRSVTPPGTRQMEPRRNNQRGLAPMDTRYVPVSVPVGIARPDAARASASMHLLPDDGPSTTDGCQLSSWQRTADCPPCYPLLEAIMDQY